MLKRDDYRKLPFIYRSMVNLYGAIDSKRMFPLLEYYLPNITKDEFLNNLLLRYKNDNPGFRIHRYDLRHYLIYSDEYTFQMAEKIASYELAPNYYRPEQYDALMSYGTKEKWNNENEHLLSDLNYLLKMVLGSSESDEALLLVKTMKKILNTGGTSVDFYNYLKMKELDNDENHIYILRMIGTYHELEMYAKRHCYRGYSLREIWKKEKEI